MAFLRVYPSPGSTGVADHAATPHGPIKHKHAVGDLVVVPSRTGPYQHGEKISTWVGQVTELNPLGSYKVKPCVAATSKGRTVEADRALEYREPKRFRRESFDPMGHIYS